MLSVSTVAHQEPLVRRYLSAGTDRDSLQKASSASACFERAYAVDANPAPLVGKLGMEITAAIATGRLREARRRMADLHRTGFRIVGARWRRDRLEASAGASAVVSEVPERNRGKSLPDYPGRTAGRSPGPPL